MFDSAHVVWGVVLRCETGLSPPVKYFYSPFHGGASFVDHLCYFCLVFCYAFVRVCLLMSCGRLLGKGKLFSIVCDVYFLNSTTDTQS